jgi:ERCC4-type nuclease
MPGITSKNYRSILNKYENMLAVSKASLEELTQVLGHAQQAQKLYDFFNSKAEPEPKDDKSLGKGRGRGKRPIKRKR